MNDQQFDDKVRKDTAKVRKDLNTLMQDSAARLNRYENNLGDVTSKTKEDLTTWLEESISQLSKEFERLTGEAMANVMTVKKDAGHKLDHYSTKVKKIADNVPYRITKKTPSFPWVAVSITLIVGLLVGIGIRPARQLLASSTSDSI